VAAKDVPSGFGDVRAGWTLIVGGLFDPMHVASGWQVVIMSEFDNEDPGAVLECVQGISRNVPIDHSFFAMRCWQSRGLLAACRSRVAKRRVMVSPWMVRLAWEAGMNGTSLEGSAQLSRKSVPRESACTFICAAQGSRWISVSSSWWLLTWRCWKEMLRLLISSSRMPLLRSKSEARQCDGLTQERVRARRMRLSNDSLLQQKSWVRFGSMAVSK
jgi:hypothetical protein